MARVLALPFSLTTYGEVSFTTDHRRIWQDRVITTLLTELGERVMRPTFGTHILGTTFDILDEAVSTINTGIRNAFSSSLTSLTLKDVKITPDYDTGTVSSQILYYLPSGEEASTTIKTGIINRSGEIIQEF